MSSATVVRPCWVEWGGPRRIPYFDNVTPGRNESLRLLVHDACRAWLKDPESGVSLEQIEKLSSLDVFHRTTFVCFQKDLEMGEPPLGPLGVATVAESILEEISLREREDACAAAPSTGERYLFLACLENSPARAKSMSVPTASSSSSSSSSPSSSSKTRGGILSNLLRPKNKLQKTGRLSNSDDSLPQVPSATTLLARSRASGNFSALPADATAYGKRRLYLLGFVRVHSHAVQLATRMVPERGSRASRRYREGEEEDDEAPGTAVVAVAPVNGRPVREPVRLLPLECASLDVAPLLAAASSSSSSTKGVVDDFATLRLHDGAGGGGSVASPVAPARRMVPSKYVYVFHWDPPETELERRLIVEQSDFSLERSVATRVELLCKAYCTHHESQGARGVASLQAKRLPLKEPLAYQRDRLCTWFLLHVFCHTEEMRAFYVESECLLLRNALASLEDADDRRLVLHANETPLGALGELDSFRSFEDALCECLSQRLDRALLQCQRSDEAHGLMDATAEQLGTVFHRMLQDSLSYFNAHVPHLFPSRS